MKQLIDKPIGPLFACLGLVLALAAGVPRLSIDDDLNAYFSADDPKLAELREFERVFTSEDTVGFVFVPAGGDVFAPDALARVRELSERAWLLPYSQRVLSMATHQHSTAQGDDLFVAPLIPPSGELTHEVAERIRSTVLDSPEMLNRYASESAGATTLFVRLALPPGASAAKHEVVTAARNMRDAFVGEYPDARVLLSGTAVTDVVLGEAVAKDFRTLVPLTVIIIAGGLWLLFRSGAAMVVTMLVVVCSVLSTMGVFGWLRAELASVAGFVPTVVMTIAVADAVHIVVTYAYHLRLGEPRPVALREAMRINVEPVLITSLTTAIGVLGLNFSDSPPYQALGNMVAVGVGFAFLYSIVLLPAALALLPARWFQGGHREVAAAPVHPMHYFAAWVLRHRRKLLAVFAIAVPLMATMVLNNRLTERWFEYFDKTFEYRQSIEVINDEISGIDGIRYTLDSGVENGVNDPAYLRQLDAFAEWLRRQPAVVHVEAFSDVMKRLNQNLHGDDPAWYRLPDQRDLAAQYLLLYELSLPQGLGLDTTLDIDRSASRLAVYMQKIDSDALLQFEQRARVWLADNAPAILPTNGTGMDVMFAHLNIRNIRGMLRGSAVALLLISVVLVLALRSVRMGVVSMVPNLVPATLAYGVWGMTVGQINLAVSVVITMSLGIVVDDTVHFLSKYLRARRERGLDAPSAVHYAFETVGVALTITTVVLVAGFSLLAASHFTPTRETGTLLAITLAFALVVDFLLLPPVLVAVDGAARGRGRSSKIQRLAPGDGV
jgi:predicted RND superfamily exporter protein